MTDATDIARRITITAVELLTATHEGDAMLIRLRADEIERLIKVLRTTKEPRP